MRVLQVITSLRVGGAERLVVELAIGLNLLGVKTDVAILDGTPSLLLSRLYDNGIKVHIIGKGWWAMRNPLNLLPLMKIMKNYDIIHSHNTICQYFVSIGKTNKNYIVSTEHNTNNRRRNWPLFHIVDRLMYLNYRKIICVSEGVENRLNSYLRDIGRNMTMVIHNGVCLNQRVNAPVKKYDKKVIRVTMAAGFRKQKDHKTLIKAMQLLPENYYLDLAGVGPLEKECRQLVTNLGLENRVAFLGFCKNVDVLLESTDIAVLSTHHEGESLWALEAIAAGVPLIATDVQGVSDNVGSVSFLVPENDATALAQALILLGENENIREQYSKKANEWVVEHDINNTIQSHLHLYKKLLNS